MKYILVCCALMFSGCQSLIYGEASSMGDLTLGMNKTQVVGTMGNPDSFEADGDKNEETLIFKKMRHAISEWPILCFVTLRSGKVVKWGELKPSATPIQQNQTINVAEPTKQ